MVNREILEQYKKELFDLPLHLENWLKTIVIESWDSKHLRDEIIRKIFFFKTHGHCDPFHPCIDRDKMVKRMKEEGA